jgi:hypothetical protein
MKQFLINAAPILKKISHENETMVLLKDQPWIYIDGKNDDEKYLFHENGEVIVDKAHNPLPFKWEFQAATNKLQIKKPDTFEFFIVYIDKAIVVIQKNASQIEFEYLANTKYLPDLKVEQYLHNVIAKHLNLSLVHVTNGFDLEIHRRHAEEAVGTNGQEVTCDLMPLADGFYQSSNSNFIYEIHDSKIVHKKSVQKITLSDGASASLYTENKTAFVSVGDNVAVNLKPLDNGKYFTDDAWFSINNGTVNKAGSLKKYKTNLGNLIIEQNDSKPMAGDIAYFEGGKPFEGEVSIGLFKKVKGVNGKIA